MATRRKTHPAVRQNWEESERGWGTRPDGYSLHLTLADAKAYANQFLKEQYKRLGEEVPDEYVRCCGEPYLVDVDDATYRMLKKHGVIRT
jgi:hypothetical protein